MLQHNSLPGNRRVEALPALQNGRVLVQCGYQFFQYDTANGKATPLTVRNTGPVAGKYRVQHCCTLPSGTLLAATDQGLAQLSVGAGTLTFTFYASVNKATEWANYQFIAPLNDTLLLLQTYSTNLYYLSCHQGILKVLREVARTPFRTNGLAVAGGYAYLATTSGLLRLHIDTGVLEEQPSAISAACTGIVKENEHILWVTTANGLYRYDAGNGSTVHYLQQDGLQDALFNPGALAALPNGSLAAAGVNGLNIFRPQLLSPRQDAAGIAVTAIEVNDAPLPPGHNPATCAQLALDYRHNTLSFAFSTIDFTAPLQNRIWYQLTPYDARPVAAQGHGFVRYTRLPPGRYRFAVWAGSNRREIFIYIAPPWWQRWWARLLAVLLLAGIIAAAFYGRIRSIRKAQRQRLALILQAGEEERRRIARDLHDGFGARLSTLKLYLQAAEHDKTLLAQSAGLIDDAITELRHILMNLSPKTLEEHGLQAAVTDLAARISRSGALRCTADVAAFTQRLQSRAEYALYRIAQELINNALKYAGARQLYLSFVVRDAVLIFLYEDDGIGFDLASVKRGYGLTNIETNVQALAGTLTIDTNRGRGTAVTIELPLAAVQLP